MSVSLAQGFNHSDLNGAETSTARKHEGSSHALTSRRLATHAGRFAITGTKYRWRLRVPSMEIDPLVQNTAVLNESGTLLSTDFTLGAGTLRAAVALGWRPQPRRANRMHRREMRQSPLSSNSSANVHCTLGESHRCRQSHVMLTGFTPSMTRSSALVEDRGEPRWRRGPRPRLRLL